MEARLFSVGYVDGGTEAVKAEECVFAEENTQQATFLLAHRAVEVSLQFLPGLTSFRSRCNALRRFVLRGEDVGLPDSHADGSLPPSLSSVECEHDEWE